MAASQPSGTWPGNLFASGTIAAAGGVVLSSGSVTAAMIQAFAGIPASSSQQQPSEFAVFCDAATNPAVSRRFLYRVNGATATVQSFGALACVAAGAASSVVFDLWKNGVSILSATLLLDSTTAAYALKTGTLTSTALVAGDVLEALITSVAGANLPRGVCCPIVVREDAQ